MSFDHASAWREIDFPKWKKALIFRGIFLNFPKWKILFLNKKTTTQGVVVACSL